MHPVALSVVAAAAMSATTAVAQTRLVTEEMMVKSPDPGIEIYVRNKRPAQMTMFRPCRRFLPRAAKYPPPQLDRLVVGHGHDVDIHRAESRQGGAARALRTRMGPADGVTRAGRARPAWRLSQGHA